MADARDSVDWLGRIGCQPLNISEMPHAWLFFSIIPFLSSKMPLSWLTSEHSFVFHGDPCLACSACSLSWLRKIILQFSFLSVYNSCHHSESCPHKQIHKNNIVFIKLIKLRVNLSDYLDLINKFHYKFFKT